MPDHQQIKDHHAEARIFVRRLLLAGLSILLLVSVLIARYYDLQVNNYEDYVTRSDKNRVQVQPVPPSRGLIYDRDGVILADNRPSYTLVILKERASNLEETLGLLQTLLGLTAEDIDKFHTRLRQRRRPYEEVPLRYQLTEQEIALLAVNEYRLPGVEVKAELVRYYPHGVLTAHNVGYVGRINDAELAGFSEEEYPRYSGTHTIGKLGVEKHYESILLGEVGYQNVEVNARGRVLRVLERGDPVQGQSLTLFLDAHLQQVAVDALAGRRGSVVAIEVKTGGVVAMVSAPSYDPNLFVTGISYKDYQALRDSLDLPLFNRTIQGQYPPGSTVKPMLGMSGLYYGTIDMNSSVYDPGFFQLPGEKRKYRDWKREGHGGRIHLTQAVAESCDVFFYDLAYRTGIDRMHAFGVYFGLGALTGIDVTGERTGIWPSREWKRGARGLAWYPGDSINMGIGQGDVLTTPMQLAVMTATLASRGELLRPRLVSHIGTQYQAKEVISQLDGNDIHWDNIVASMVEVVHGPRGTAKGISQGLTYRIAGKTGTAQVVGIAQGEKYNSAALRDRHRDHALFVAFAPADDPRLAVAVIVENGEKSSEAAKITRELFDAYLAEPEPGVNAEDVGEQLLEDAVVPAAEGATDAR
jgi:penicillin-binding protein 2